MATKLVISFLILLSNTPTVFSGALFSKPSPQVYLVPGVSIDYMNKPCTGTLTWSNFTAKQIIEIKESILCLLKACMFEDHCYNNFVVNLLSPYLKFFPKCQQLYSQDLKLDGKKFIQEVLKALENLVLQNQAIPKLNPEINPFMIQQFQKLANFLQQNIIICEGTEVAHEVSARTCLSALEHELLLKSTSG